MQSEAILAKQQKLEGKYSANHRHQLVGQLSKRQLQILMDNLSGECQLLIPDIVEAQSQQPLYLLPGIILPPMQTLKYEEWSELTNYQQMHANRRKELISRVMRQAHVYAQCNHSASL